jgi:hypothetical protein
MNADGADLSTCLSLPAVLDLVRILASISPALGAYRSSSGSSIVQIALSAADWSNPWAASKERETNTMLAMRALANLFSTRNGKEALLAEPGCEEVSHSMRHADVSRLVLILIVVIICSC